MNENKIYSQRQHSRVVFSPLRTSCSLRCLTPQSPLTQSVNTYLATPEYEPDRSKTFTAANRSFYNYLILLFLIVFPIGAAFKVLIGNEYVTRTVILYITAFTYLFHIIRRGQIFASVCNPFTTFLYLCGLELLPTAVLVLSAKLL